MAHEALDALEEEVSHCRRCPRLVEWREETARVKRAAYRDEEYWGRPIRGFGNPDASILVLGLAPAAHGGNRTGRIFTGDRSGDFLFAGLYRAGLCNQPESIRWDDGLVLHGAFMTAAVKCAPPANKPTPQERDTCLEWARQELEHLPNLRAVLCLGAFAWDAGLRLFGDPPRPKPKFGHLAEFPLTGTGLTLLGCFHPSQQNTFTGVLTPAMLDAAIERAKEIGLA